MAAVGGALYRQGIRVRYFLDIPVESRSLLDPRGDFKAIRTFQKTQAGSVQYNGAATNRSFRDVVRSLWRDSKHHVFREYKRREPKGD